MTDQTSQHARAFLSYSRKDAATATRVFDALKALGVDVFRDTEDILPAEDWRDRLRGLITSADAVVYLVSPASVASQVCGWEVDVTTAQNKRLIPVLLTPVDEALTPAEVTRLNYVFATDDHDFDAAMAKTASAINTDIEWVRDHTRYGERAAEWATARRNRSGLLRGAELATAEAWLGRQPINAPTPSPDTRDWLTTSRKAATTRQRNWAAGSLMVAAVSIGLGITAEVNRRVAADQRDRAERILDRSSQTANDLVFDMAQRFRDRSGVPQDLVQDLLGRSKGLLDQLGEAGEARPDLQRSRAAALTEMSITLTRQGDLTGAKDAATEATALFRTLAQTSAPETQADLAVGLDREGDILLQLGEEATAADRYDEALTINRNLIETSDTTSPAWLINLAVSEEKHGDIAAREGRLEDALAAFQRALTIRGDAGPPGRGVAILREKQGDAFLARGTPKEARVAYLASLALTTDLAQATPDDTRLARDKSVIHQKLGDLLLAEDDIEAAAPHFAEDLSIARTLHEGDPSREDWALDLGVSLDRYGVLKFQQGEIDHAIALLGEGFALLSERASAQPTRTDLQQYATKAGQKLSLVAFAADDYRTAAATAAEDEARIAEAIGAGADLGDEHADAVNNVAWYNLFTNMPDTALAAAKRATGMRPANAAYQLNLAHALLLTGNKTGATAIYHRETTEPWRDMIIADWNALSDAGIAPELIDSARAALLE